MFNGKTIKDLQNRVDELESVTKTLTKLVKTQSEKINAYDEIFKDYEALSLEKALAKRSNEPWAGFSVSEVTKDGRIGLKLDWNDQFVEHLRKNGIDGGSDEDTVGIWFASVVKEMGEEIDHDQAAEILKNQT